MHVHYDLTHFHSIYFFFQFEEAAKEVVGEINPTRKAGEEELQDIQVIVSSDERPHVLRGMKVQKAYGIRRSVESYDFFFIKE